MAEADIKPGDVVRLKSGGPPMSVTQVDTEFGTTGLSAWVVWFEGKKKQEAVIPLPALTKDVPGRISTGETDDRADRDRMVL